MTPHSDATEVDDASYIADDWHRCQALERLVNHWNRPGWVDGGRSYHWLLSFRNQPEVRALAARCQAHLEDFRTLDLVPIASLHVTALRAGFTDEMSRAEAEAVAEAVSKRCATLAPMTLRVGPLAGSAGAVRFSAGPHEPVRRVLAELRAAMADVRGTEAPPDQPHPFIPHVSIAYSNTDMLAGPVIERVAALRELGFTTTRVDCVDLVELRREGRSYAWDTLSQVEFAQAIHP
ncbi:MAG: hypothetical protein AUI14_07315 [Actinobacteria bacterium 13_2_20CM_2_71_6]|nr:MAG: hypothetical protein AUI14_07315 [Actinobacteria bacterium 13_2_20CM_2_71_6]